MQEGTLSSYGGSAEQAADSRRTHETLNQGGMWRAWHGRASVTFVPYADDDVVLVVDSEKEE